MLKRERRDKDFYDYMDKETPKWEVKRKSEKLVGCIGLIRWIGICTIFFLLYTIIFYGIHYGFSKIK